MKPEKIDPKYLIAVGTKIAEKRRLRGEKESSLAKAVGLSQGIISEIENGRYYSLKLTTLIEIYEYLQIPLADTPPYNMIKHEILLTRYCHQQ